MVSFRTLSNDNVTQIFAYIIEPGSGKRLSVRAVSRLYEYSYLILSFYPFSQAFINCVHCLHLSYTNHPFLDNWVKIFSLISRHNDTLQELYLEDFDFLCREEDKSRYSIGTQKQLTLPKLRIFKSNNANAYGFMHIIDSLQGRNLNAVHLDPGYAADKRYLFDHEVNSFLSRGLLFSLSRFEALGVLELKHFYIKITFFQGQQTRNLLGRLRSLAMIDFKFESPSSDAKLLTMLGNRCEQLSALVIRSHLMKREAIVQCCIDRDVRLRKLTILACESRKDSRLTDLCIRDTDVVKIINNCPNLISIHVARGELVNYASEIVDTSEDHLTGGWIVHAAEKLGSQLEHIGVSHMLIQRTVLKTVAEKCSQLKSITLRNCSIRSLETIEIQTFFEKLGTSLQALNMHGTQIVRKEYLQIMRAYLSSSRLETFHVSVPNPIHFIEDMKLLLEKICGSLHELTLCCSYFDSTEIFSLLQVIQEHADPEKLVNLNIHSIDAITILQTIRNEIETIENEFKEVVLRCTTFCHTYDASCDEMHLT